jgi:hypothetical protein
MHRVLSVGSLEVTDSKAHELKGVSLDALVASLIRGAAFLLSATTQEALMDATMQLYHGCVSSLGVKAAWKCRKSSRGQADSLSALPGNRDADRYWDVPSMLADLDSESVDEALWEATVATTATIFAQGSLRVCG